MERNLPGCWRASRRCSTRLLFRDHANQHTNLRAHAQPRDLSIYPASPRLDSAVARDDQPRWISAVERSRVVGGVVAARRSADRRSAWHAVLDSWLPRFAYHRRNPRTLSARSEER